MATIIRTQGLSITPDLRAHLTRRLTFALRRFQNRITQTEVFIKGPVDGKHGVDRRVVVKVGLVDREAVVVESSAHNHFIAVSLAARRCKRSLKRAFKQPLAKRRERPRRASFESAVGPVANPG